MGDTTSLTVDASTGERFRRLKAALNDAQDGPDHTTDSFLAALLDTWENDGQSSRTHEILSDVGADPEEIADEVSRRFDYARIATETADEVEGRLR